MNLYASTEILTWFRQISKHEGEERKEQKRTMIRKQLNDIRESLTARAKGQIFCANNIKEVCMMVRNCTLQFPNLANCLI